MFASLPAILAANPFTATLEDEATWLKDETYVISASRVKESVKKASASITVIDEEMIRNMGAHTLTDVLRTVPGFGVSQSNIYVDKISVRGIETWFSEKVLVLLDGHSLNSDLLNGGATGTFANLPMEHVRRIEIIRGPASALYGENAFTALINIITKTGGEIDGVRVSARAGSFDERSYDLLLGNNYGPLELSANLNVRRIEGYRASIDEDTIGNSGRIDPSSERLYAHLSLRHENGFYAKAALNKAEDGPRYGAAHALNDEDLSKRKAYFAEFGYARQLDESYGINAKIYHDHFTADNLWRIFPAGFPAPAYTDGMLAVSGYTNIRSGIDALLTYKSEEYTIVSGLSYEIQKLTDPIYKANYHPLSGAPLAALQNFSDPDTNFVSEAKRKFWAVYGELLYDPADNVRLSAGVRYDHYSDFGGVVNPRLGAVWGITADNTLKLMYGEAFRAPTFAELYNKNNPALVGNADLTPEKVRTLELSFQNSSVDNLLASLCVFRSTISDIITSSGNTYVNKGAVTTRGIELELKYDLWRGSYVTAHYTYRDPENDDTSRVLENIYRHEAYAALNYRINRHFNAYADVKYIGEQTRGANDPRPPVESSMTGNITLLAKDWLAKNVQMKFSVFNIFDEKSYNSFSPYDYPLPGRSYMAEVSYKF